MANNAVINRFGIYAFNGWVKLSQEPLVADVTIYPTGNTFSIRVDGGTAVSLPSGSQWRLEGVDLSTLEISTTSGTPVNFYVIGNTRFVRS